MDLDSPSTLALIAHEIASRVFSLLSRELDQADEAFLTSVSLASLGIDSLITIEARNWWRRTFCSDQLYAADECEQLFTVSRTGNCPVERGKQEIGFGT